jgi:hypothetical protein
MLRVRAASTRSIGKLPGLNLSKSFVVFSYDAMLHLSSTPTLHFFFFFFVSEPINFFFVVPYGGQLEVFFRTVNLILENISKLHSLYFKARLQA